MIRGGRQLALCLFGATAACSGHQNALGGQGAEGANFVILFAIFLTFCAVIPGRVTDIEFLPTRTGIFRGQCAEFCGVQHTHMALDVIVEPVADFRRWYAHQLALAPSPATPLQLAGYRYVVSRECSSCHNIAGTPASGQIAPDLTHVAGRRSIAAGTLPLNRGNLYGWVADPQSQKAGNRMPTIAMEPDELHAVVAYLETLK